MCDSGKDETLVDVLKYRPDFGKRWVIVPLKNFQFFLDELKEGQPGETWAVAYDQMKKCDLEALPEHEGW